MGLPKGLWPAGRLEQVARAKQSLLCVGLDPVPAKLPTAASTLLDFCKAIVEATAPYSLAYKVNFAYFEALGPAGWELLYALRKALPDDTFLIADAKRGDVGHTAERYAHAIFDELAFDAVTLSPYLGFDSVAPFLAYPDRFVFLLGLTSNPGAADVQLLRLADGRSVHQAVIESAQGWATQAQVGFVAGATRPEALATIRQWAPHAWLLVPGIGSQGGSAEAVLQAAATEIGGVLLTASRSILYASAGTDYAEAAAAAAKQVAFDSAPFVGGYRP